MKRLLRVGQAAALGLSLAALSTGPLACGKDDERPKPAHEEAAAGEHAGEAPGHEEGEGEETVRLAPEVLTEFGIEVATAGPGPIASVWSQM